MNSHFAGTGSRDEIARTEQVKEFFPRKPLSPAGEFVLHYRDVRSRSSEGCRSQPEKEQGKLVERNLSVFGDRFWRFESGLFTHLLRPVFLPTIRQENMRQHQPKAEK